jgi:hypothetical protein
MHDSLFAHLLLDTPENGRQPKDTMDHAQEYDRYHSGPDFTDLEKPARLRRSRAVRSPRPRTLTRAIERGAEPRQAVTQWQACGGSMQQLVKRAQGRQS